MGQKCCSLLTGRAALEEAPLRPHSPWHQQPGHGSPYLSYPQYGASAPPYPQHGASAPPYPQYGASAPQYPQYGASAPPKPEQKTHHAHQGVGHIVSGSSHQKVQCSTSGCTRQPWNGTYGESCCRTCGKSSGRDHGPDCNRRFQRMVEASPGFGFAQSAPGPPMPQAGHDATCKSCGNTGQDFRGNPCVCRASQFQSMQLCDFQAAEISSAQACIVSGVNAGQLPEFGSFHWILKSNDPEHRKLRLEAAKQTQHACTVGSYKLGGAQVPLKLLKQMCAQTRLVFSRDVVGLSSPREAAALRFFIHGPGQSATIALNCSRSGVRTSLVNASSSYHVGGGFLSGGRHALEESLCMQSTLFHSLQVASGHKHDCYHSPYIPNNAVVLSPDVEFFRSGSLDGYRFQKQAESIAAVISVAMPNRNPQVKDAPMDAPAVRETYLDVLYQKFVAVLVAAASVEASALVVPDVGCGVYGNSPLDVGAALGKAIKTNFPHRFSEIHLVGSNDFANAAKCA